MLRASGLLLLRLQGHRLNAAEVLRDYLRHTLDVVVRVLLQSRVSFSFFGQDFRDLNIF